MFAHAVRLNVGQVEALTLTADQARFLIQAPLSAEDLSPRHDGFPTFNGSGASPLLSHIVLATAF
jgi:hypothetical protein